MNIERELPNGNKVVIHITEAEASLIRDEQNKIDDCCDAQYWLRYVMCDCVCNCDDPDEHEITDDEEMEAVQNYGFSLRAATDKEIKFGDYVPQIIEEIVDFRRNKEVYGEGGEAWEAAISHVLDEWRV